MPAISFLLLWPLIEIALFVLIGGAIGLLWTMVVVIGTAIGGVALLRRLGLSSADRLRGEMGRMRNPLGVVGDGALLALAGLLLILPGFLTDMLGLFLLLSPVRRILVAALARRITAASMRSDQPARRSDGIVIDGEFVEIDDIDMRGNPPEPSKPSGWTRH